MESWKFVGSRKIDLFLCSLGIFVIVYLSVGIFVCECGLLLMYLDIMDMILENFGMFVFGWVMYCVWRRFFLLFEFFLYVLKFFIYLRFLGKFYIYFFFIFFCVFIIGSVRVIVLYCGDIICCWF